MIGGTGTDVISGLITYAARPSGIVTQLFDSMQKTFNSVLYCSTYGTFDECTVHIRKVGT